MSHSDTPENQENTEKTSTQQPEAAVHSNGSQDGDVNEELAGLYADIEELKAKAAEVESLQAKNAELSEQFLRAKADAENARRRAEEDVAKARKFGIESFAQDLLAVADSLDAALAIESATAEQLLEGTKATQNQLLSVFERHKLSPINPEVGSKFDPNHHQAISAVPSQQEPGTIVAVLQKGYVIADRVLRPALVTVAAE
ncbi:molecular chaperone GrpE [Lampropedia cohaerens]|uniref:Protein GrpE n=1 Tax=Lampropedia cohaerens TaxID=1610491 RepID=A0A0U1Q166_9BURK|nr:nucleotide exchange factor GrpE [Lampropedia cohaerens]KKW68509.1 molecular chaperone GrpE [Lampropedia cohaerens]